MTRRIRDAPYNDVPERLSDFAGMFDDPELELAAAIIGASATDGYVDTLVDVVNAYIEQRTGKQQIGTALALRYYHKSLAGACTHRDNLLRELRLSKRLTQGALAKLVSTSTTVIANIEKAGIYPNLEFRARLAKALDVNSDAIWPEI